MAKLGGKKADIGREQSTSSSPFCTAAFKLPAKIRVLALRNIYSTAYIYSRVALDLSRLRGIEWFEEYGGGCHVQPLCSFTVSRRGGGEALVGRGCCRECGRICIIVRTNFELCQKDLVGSSRGVCLRQCCRLRFLVRRSRIPSE